MDLDQFLGEYEDLPDEEKAFLRSIVDVDPEEFRARYTRYTSIQTRNAASKARRDRLNSTKASKGTANSPRNNRSDKEQSPARTSSLTAYMRSQTTHMADALLHNDARPGYAGPATVSLDSEGILHLARKLPGMVFCLKIYYVNEVNPIWNIALRAVNDLKVWLDRQFLAPQQITRMPKLNPRAVTTLDQVWELLAEFDATAKHKSAFIRATPIALASKIPIVEASVIFPIQPAQTAVAIPQVGMIAGSSMPDTSNHLAPPKSHDKQGPAGPSTYHNVFPQSGEMSLHHKNQVQRAEIVRLKTSVYKYSTRIRGANGEIRSLRNDLRDAQNRNSDLQDKYDRAKTMVDRTAGTEATAEAVSTDLSQISPDSIQQASDLADEILAAAHNLVAVVEAYATIRPGVTERTLQDLQLVADVLGETARDVKDEPVPGYAEKMDVEVSE